MQYSLVWYRQDLRVRDHEPLVNAAKSGFPVIALYCFDPRQYKKTSFGFAKTGIHRAQFIIESVTELHKQLQAIGVKLIVKIGHPEEVLKELTHIFDIQEIHYHEEIGSEEQQVEQLVRQCCPKITFYAYKGQTLVHPDDLPFHIATLPDLFTHFRKLVEKKLLVRESLPIPKLTHSDTSTIEHTNVPTLQQLGFEETLTQSIYQGGQTAGEKRLDYYLFKTNAIQTYKETRNGMLKQDDSSKLSPYLAHGCLSSRYVYWELKRYEQEHGANESTYWLFFELLWRDYFKFVHMKYGNRLFKTGGLNQLRLTWSEDEHRMTAWLNGQTGYPLVDANMMELKQTGFMSNRGRQNVASFLTKNLGIDWRFGAEWFESMLIDYDVSSNYGNWCYVAGVGNDARQFRIFNVTKQGKAYDPEGQYAKHWLPMLQNIPGGQVYDVPFMSAKELSAYNIEIGQHYAAPIVDFFQSAEIQKQVYTQANIK